MIRPEMENPFEEPPLILRLAYKYESIYVRSSVKSAERVPKSVKDMGNDMPGV